MWLTVVTAVWERAIHCPSQMCAGCTNIRTALTLAPVVHSWGVGTGFYMQGINYFCLFFLAFAGIDTSSHRVFQLCSGGGTVLCCRGKCVYDCLCHDNRTSTVRILEFGLTCTCTYVYVYVYMYIDTLTWTVSVCPYWTWHDSSWRRFLSAVQTAYRLCQRHARASNMSCLADASFCLVFPKIYAAFFCSSSFTNLFHFQLYLMIFYNTKNSRFTVYMYPG